MATKASNSQVPVREENVNAKVSLQVPVREEKVQPKAQQKLPMLRESFKVRRMRR